MNPTTIEIIIMQTIISFLTKGGHALLSTVRGNTFHITLQTGLRQSFRISVTEVGRDPDRGKDKIVGPLKYSDFLKQTEKGA